MQTTQRQGVEVLFGRGESAVLGGVRGELNKNVLKQKCSVTNQKKDEVLTGGDLNGELNEIELDALLRHVADGAGVKVLAAATAVRGSAIMVKNEIKDNEVLYVPFWCRHHWTLLRVTKGVAELYDSAPSDAVHRDARKWTSAFGLRLVICPCPQQYRGSVECGVFVVGFLLCLTKDVKMRHGKISLSSVREKLCVKECPKIEWFSAMMETSMKGGSRDWVSIHNENERACAAKNLCFMLVATLAANIINESLGLEELEWSIPALERRARRLGFAKNVQDDAMMAISRMAEKGITKVASVMAFEVNEIQDCLPRIVQWLTAEDAQLDLNEWEIMGGIDFHGTLINYEGMTAANGGHYRLTSGWGRNKIARRLTPQEKADRLTRLQQINNVSQQTESTNNNVIGEESGEPTVITHDSIRASLKKIKVGEGVRAAWTTLFESTTLWGKKTRGGSVEWSLKLCNCGDWRKISEDIEEICPIPEAEYFYFKAAQMPKLCECAGDDDDEDETAPAVVTQRKEWLNKEEMAILGSKPKAGANQMKGNEGRFWNLYTKRPPHVHVLVWKALAESTRKKHIDWLLMIKAMPEDLSTFPFPNAIVELVMRLANERDWAWSTVSSTFSTIQTALRSLPLYSNMANGIDIKECAIFQAATQRAQKLARIAGPSSQLSVPMEADTMTKMVRGTQDIFTRSFLALCWHFAARASDLRQVRPEDIRLPANGKWNTPTTITFKLGKGGAFWGPFTIAAVIPADTARDVAQICEQRRTQSTLFTMTHQRHVSTMVAKEGLNLRSIRRGALIHNSNKGVSDSNLQLLSGHKRLDTLMRYLGWGVSSSTAKKAAKKRHAQVLEGSGFPTEPKKMGQHAGYQGVKGRRIEKPPTFFCHRPPTRQALGLRAISRSELPLHIKNVGTMNVEAVRTMAAGTKYKDGFEKGVQWLTGEPYNKLNVQRIPAKSKIPKAKFNEAQILQLYEAKKIVPLRGVGRAFVNVFGVEDRNKGRIRVLGEPYVNRLVEPEVDYPELNYMSRLERRAQMVGATHVLECDYAAFFDQMALDDEAQKYHVLRSIPTKGEDMWTLTKLPMGARYSPSIAQHTTWIVSEPLTRIPGVTVSTMIDNVRITAKDGPSFVKAVKTFLLRSSEAGLTLNPESDKYKNASDSDIDKWGRENMQKPFVFLGEAYHQGKVYNNDKLIDKLKESMKDFPRTDMTRRELAARVGLLLFMAHTINIRICHHYGLLRAYAELFQGTLEWDAPVGELTDNVIEGVRNLASVVLKNEPVNLPVLKKPSTIREDYDAVIMFDACQVSWAAKMHIMKTGKTFRILKAFASTLKHSAHAEPRAATELCKWVKTNFPEIRRVALVTDHMALARGQIRWWSGNGGFSTAFFINEAFKEINDFAEVFHVQGESNLCDADSRSAEAAKSKNIAATEIEMVWPDLQSFEHPFLVRPALMGY